MFKKILVPLDGSVRAEQALALVWKLLPPAELDLILLEVTEAPNMIFPLDTVGIDGYVHFTSEEILRKVDEYIGEVTDKVRAWSPKVRGVHLDGNPDEAIVDIATKEEVDLIVMVTHGYKGIERFLFGSVTEKVIRDAPCPVLAIRDGHLPNHILISLDGTPFSETILEPALALARLVKAKVTLARVDVPEEDLSLRDVQSIRQFDKGLAESMLYYENQKEETYLEDIRGRLMRDPANADLDLDIEVDRGAPGVRLPIIAKRVNSDLIAMATHGRKGIDRFFNRSVTENVMHHTEVAMLVLHPTVMNESVSS